MSSVGIVGYSVAALAYAVTALILYFSRPVRGRPSFVEAAVVVSGIWAAGIALELTQPQPSVAVVVGLDSLHLFVWTTCVLSWLAAGSAKRVLIVVSAATGLWALAMSLPVADAYGLQQTMYIALVVNALITVLAVEQVMRNTKAEQHSSLKLLCVAVGGTAMVDLFVYSQAALLGEFVFPFWESRGFANAVFLPLIVLGIKRQAHWERELFVSRQVVFYTASLLGVGGYLLGMGVVAYLIRANGHEWTFVVELSFLCVAAALLAFVLFSTSIRARLRAFLVKNFYRNKYDYRQEWLRLTQNLGRSGDLSALASSGLETMAQLANSRHGAMWIARDIGHYEWMSSLGSGASTQRAYLAQHPIIRFLAQRSWVIDTQEYAAYPDRYQTAFEDDVLPQDAIIVPLDCQGYLQGFVVLKKAPEAGALDFEDHDILKTAGKQVAVALAQSLAIEKLFERRQFDAANKMSMFLMHDLKNIIAQQQLIVSNAARFRQRPEFVDDAVATVRSGVERMRHLLEQLDNSRFNHAVVGRADVSKVLMEVRSHCADRAPIPEVCCKDTTIWVRIDKHKLTAVITHLVRNAQDATPADGRVQLDVTVEGPSMICTISDTGSGMDEVFIRDRLFRAFDSTKGVHGMGIGAYQVRDIVRAAGGEITVTSAPGKGSTFRVRLPLANCSGIAPAISNSV